MHVPPILMTAPRSPRRRRQIPLVITTTAATTAIAIVVVAAGLLANSDARLAWPTLPAIIGSHATLGDLMASVRETHELSVYGMGGPLPGLLLPTGATAGVSYDQYTTIDGAFVAFSAYEFSSPAAANDYAAISGGNAGGRLVLLVGFDAGGGSRLTAVFEAVTR